MHVIQLSLQSWLVLDAQVKPRYLIERGPMVNKSTQETHIVHKVSRWALQAGSRDLLAVCDGEMAAREWCDAALRKQATADAQLKESLRAPAEMYRHPGNDK